MDILLAGRCLGECSNKFLVLKGQHYCALFGCSVKGELDSAKIQMWKLD